MMVELLKPDLLIIPAILILTALAVFIGKDVD